MPFGIAATVAMATLTIGRDLTPQDIATTLAAGRPTQEVTEVNRVRVLDLTDAAEIKVPLVTGRVIDLE